MTTFAKRLEEALCIRNIKPAELSRLTGLTEGQISAYRKGTYKAKQDGIYKIAKALNVSEAWLMGYEANIERTPDNLRTSDFGYKISPAEKDLLSDFRLLNEAGQNAAAAAVRSFTQMDQFRKDTEKIQKADAG